ncbi:hypothetical protein [Nonomuraea rosea]
MAGRHAKAVTDVPAKGKLKNKDSADSQESPDPRSHRARYGAGEET